MRRYLLLVLTAALLAGVTNCKSQGSTEQPAATETDAESANPAESNETDGGEPVGFDVPDCPIRLAVGDDFQEPTVPPDSKYHLIAPTRGLDLGVSCRDSEEDFEPDQFLEETERAVRARHKDDVTGFERIETSGATGWMMQFRKEDDLRHFNVLVRNRTVVIVTTSGPPVESTSEFTKKLLTRYVKWDD